MTNKHICHVISHTHWDREWYLPFQLFRKQLVGCIDELLDILETDPDFFCFHLDGQTVVLEDYLEIRPENERRLRDLIGAGRILIGPFYLACDEYLTSGEAQIRNLLRGHAICAAFGATPMPVGYVLDQFGHHSQTPQILRGFGFDNVVMGRGITMANIDNKTEFRWRGADGSEMLGVFMVHWYNNAQRWPDDRDEAVEYTQEIVKRLSPHATTPHLLLMNGVDHLYPQRGLPAILKQVNPRLKDAEVVQTDMPAFIEAVRGAVGDLPVHQGEMYEEGFSSLLIGTHSSHPEIKRANFDCQTLLERQAEPWAALAGAFGHAYDHGLLNHAWKLLLLNHPHDSICGCSVEQVHREMMPRFEQCEQIGRAVRGDALGALAGRIKTGADEHSLPLVLFNPATAAREDVVECEIDVPIDRISDFDAPRIETSDGTPVPVQVNSMRETDALILHPTQLPRRAPVRRYGVTLQPPTVPGLGWQALRVLPAPHGHRWQQPDGGIAQGPRTMDNGMLAVEIGANGALCITDRRSGRTFKDALTFQDGGDAGNSYDYLRPWPDEVVTSSGGAARIALVENGPLSATFHVVVTLSIPVAAQPGPREVGPRGINSTAPKGPRAVERVDLPIESWITLRAGEPLVRVRTVVQNTARDHRLRVLFPTDMPVEESLALSPFDVIRRPLTLPHHKATGTYPHAGWFGVRHEAQGASVFARGIYQYELCRDQRRALALTLFRATDAVFAEDPFQTGERNQIPGARAFEYAFAPLAEGDDVGALGARYERWLLPVEAVAPRETGDELPTSHGLLDLAPGCLQLTACKRAESGEGIVLRLVNLSETAVDGTLRLGVDIKAAWRADMAERRGEALTPTGGNALSVHMRPKEIVTLLLYMA